MTTTSTVVSYESVQDPDHPGAAPRQVVLSPAAHHQLVAKGVAYRSSLEAASPSNRFMRRRDGLAMTAAQRYSEQALWQARATYKHMADNDAIPALMCRRLADMVIQEAGFTPIPQTGDASLNADLLGEWHDWADNANAVDYYGKWTWSQLQWHAFRITSGEGELFPLLLDDGRIQCIDADHCGTPRGSTSRLSDETNGIQAGIRVENGRPVSAFLHGKPIGSFGSRVGNEAREVPFYDAAGFRQLCQLYLPLQLLQHRGLTPFHPVMVEAGMLEDLDFATLLKAQAGAAVTGVIKSGRDLSQSQALGTSMSTGIDGIIEEKVGFGSLLVLSEEDSLEDFTPIVPTNEQLAHAIYLLRKIGSAIDMPYEMILLDGSVTNFSGWKGATDVARRSYVRAQTHLAAQLHSPVWIWRIRQRLSALGPTARRLAATGALFRHAWNFPRWESIQRLQDAAADAQQLENNVISPRRVAGRYGLRYDEIVAETVEDNGALIEAAIIRALELNRAYPGQNVDWREVARMGQPTGMTLSGQLAVQDAKESQR